MKRQNVRTLSLIVCTFTYLLAGAAIFDALESHQEDLDRSEYENHEKTWRDKYNMSKEDYDDLYRLILKMKPYKAGTQWKFAGAFYFATTVITTIGYGHSTPKTNSGKIFCMLYAMPGIPLCIVMFQSIGERMNAFITWLLRQIKKLLKFADPSVSQSNLILISTTLGTLVLTCGAAAFKYYEDWGYLDSFYYCFITLTTIGFGDFVALQRNNSLAKRPDYVAFSLIFILFGLTVVSSAMNLLVLRFLTMNTEDERRDEMEAAAYALERGRLQGDVIVGNGRPYNATHVVTNYPVSSTPDDYEIRSVCSCTCYDSFKLPHKRFKYGRKSNKLIAENDIGGGGYRKSGLRRYTLQRRRKRYTVIRGPGTVRHLADVPPLQPVDCERNYYTSSKDPECGGGGIEFRAIKMGEEMELVTSIDRYDNDICDDDDDEEFRISYQDIHKKRASI